MTEFTLEDLAALPQPEIIEELDFDTVYARREARLQDLWDALRLENQDLPVFDTLMLKSEMVRKILEAESYEELVLRARGNEIARDNYLYYSRKSGTDHKGAFHDAFRIPGEDDERFKRRIILNIQGRSPGGTEERYEYIAMTASLRVASAKVYVEDPDPRVNIAVFATDNNGVADQSLLDTVTAAVSARDKKMVNDRFVVRSAVVRVVNVTANIWLRPDTSESVIADQQVKLANQWLEYSGLGDDLTLSWLQDAIFTPGMHRVEITSPEADEPVGPYEALRIGTVTLTYMGRDS